MKRIILFSLLQVIATVAFTQLTEAHLSTDKMGSEVRVSSELWQLGKMAQQNQLAANSKAREYRMMVRDDGKTYVNIQMGWDNEKSIQKGLLEEIGIEVQDVYRNQAGCWIHLSQIEDLSAVIPENHMIRAENQYSNDHEGIIKTNASQYQNNGATGQGLKIAIIDSGYSSLTAAQNAGTAPSSPGTIDHTGGGAPFESGTPHGTGCTEIIYEYATGATYFLHKVSGSTQLGVAVNSAILYGADLISCSTSYFNTGWADGTGAACAAAKDASDAGIPYFHGSGNFHKRHYQSTFLSTDGDDWHEFSGSDEKNNMTLDSAGSVNLDLQWAGNPSSTNDFDLYLYNDANNVLLAVSNSTNDFESINWTNNTGASITVGVAILRSNSTKINFEVFAATGKDFQYNQTGGSTASPANSPEPLVITVGVVDEDNYDNVDPPLESFCSRGPTNNGLTVPDLCAPDGLSLVSYNSFSGASAGGPNTCGVAALLWSEHTYLSAEGVIEVLFGLADLYNDWGDPGWDNSYGRGGIELNNWQENSRFIMKNAGNTTGTNDLPYADIEMTDDFCPSGKTLLFIGESFPGPLTDNLINTPMTYRSILKNTVIGN